MAVINIGDTVALQNKTGEPLGELSIQACSHGAWCGTFTPASGYSNVRDLFIEWTKLVNEQCFSLLDAVGDKISAIGISALCRGQKLPIHDLQISDDGVEIGGCFRLVA
jgi:hypothetical protein